MDMHKYDTTACKDCKYGKKCAIHTFMKGNKYNTANKMKNYEAQKFHDHIK